MPKTRNQKEESVRSFVEDAKKSKTLIFLKYKGVSVKDEQDLRRQLRKTDGRYTVLKKTLLKHAFKELSYDYSKLEDTTGSIASAFGFEDEISIAKAINEFSKSHEHVEIVGGIYEGEIISKQSVEQLATLPTKEELQAKLVYLIGSPARNLVQVMNGPIRGFVQALRALSEKQS